MCVPCILPSSESGMEWITGLAPALGRCRVVCEGRIIMRSRNVIIPGLILFVEASIRSSGM